MIDYDDNYSTCSKTSADFRIKHDLLDPNYISQLLGLSPSWGGMKGDVWTGISRPSRFGIWALSTEGNVVSRDLRRHIDWLVGQLEGKESALALLKEQDYSMDVFCNWIRLGGTGGPTLSPRNMGGLAVLGLELAFEFWSINEQEDEED